MLAFGWLMLERDLLMLACEWLSLVSAARQVADTLLLLTFAALPQSCLAGMGLQVKTEVSFAPLMLSDGCRKPLLHNLILSEGQQVDVEWLCEP